MKKTLNIILFGRKKSYFVKCTLTLIGLYLGVLFWYFNVDYLGQPIQNALVLAVCSLICISVLVALYRIPEQLCVNSQINYSDTKTIVPLENQPKLIIVYFVLHTPS